MRSIEYNGIERPEHTPDMISELKTDEVFVFGSNLEEMHGGGAAYTAFKKFGAAMGCGVGHRGQSYAIPTMYGGVEDIRPYVNEFIRYAVGHPELFFYVTRVGCGGAISRDIFLSRAASSDLSCLSSSSFLQVLETIS